MKKNLEIIVTENCNLRCKYCFYLEKPNINKQEIDFEKICDFINELKNEVEINLITITGGEPFLYKNLKELIEFCRPICSVIRIFTNGTLINESNVKFIIKNNVFLHISLDSISEEYVEKYRGGYEKIINTFTILKKYDYRRLFITCSLNKNNLNGLNDLKIFAKDNNAFLDSNFIDNAPEYQLSNELIQYDEIFKDKYLNIFEDSAEFRLKLIQYLIKGNKVKNCIVRKRSIVVDPCGLIYPCFNIKKVVGTYTDEVKEILNRLDKFNNEDFICRYTTRRCYGCI